MTMTKEQIRDLADEAMDVACAHIQKRVGQNDGGIAAQVFSDNRARDLFIAYIETEIMYGKTENAT